MEGCQEMGYGGVSGDGVWRGVRRGGMEGCQERGYGGVSGEGV